MKNKKTGEKIYYEVKRYLKNKNAPINDTFLTFNPYGSSFMDAVNSLHRLAVDIGVYDEIKDEFILLEREAKILEKKRCNLLGKISKLYLNKFRFYYEKQRKLL